MMLLAILTLPAMALSFADGDSLFHAGFSFSYPQRPSVSVSPSGTLRASFRPGVEDQWHFSISDGHGKELAGFDFGRWVDGKWAPDSDRLFVNNYEGSNVTWCLVPRTEGRSVTLVNLLESLDRQKERPVAGAPRLHIPQNPDNAHFYLTCERWLTKETIEVLVGGHTDKEGGGEDFSYRFLYSLPQDNFRPL